MCLGRELERHADLFDAVECNAMYARGVTSTGARSAWARRHGKPLVGNCEVHRLWQMGTTYSLVDAAPTRTRFARRLPRGASASESRPLSWLEVARVIGIMLAGHSEPRAVQDPRVDGNVGRLDVDDVRVLEMF